MAKKNKVIGSGFYSISKLIQLLEENINYEVLEKKDVFVTIADIDVIGNEFIKLLKSKAPYYIKKKSQVLYTT